MNVTASFIFTFVQRYNQQNSLKWIILHGSVASQTACMALLWDAQMSHPLWRCRADCGWSRRPRPSTAWHRLLPCAPHTPSSASPEAQVHTLATTPNRALLACGSAWWCLDEIQTCRLAGRLWTSGFRNMWLKCAAAAGDQTGAFLCLSETFPGLMVVRSCCSLAPQIPQQELMFRQRGLTFCAWQRDSSQRMNRRFCPDIKIKSNKVTTSKY